MRQFIFLPIFILSFGASAQLSTSYVENWINSCEPEGNLDSLERLYIIHGVPFDNPDDELKSFDTKNQLWYIDYLNSDSVETTFMKPNLLVILVGATPKLKKGERNEKLQEQQVKFSDEFNNSFNLHPDPSDPVLILNDKLVSPENARQAISELRPNDVRYIQYVNHTSFALYGRNAKNGAVTIWTKEYAR